MSGLPARAQRDRVRQRAIVFVVDGKQNRGFAGPPRAVQQHCLLRGSEQNRLNDAVRGRNVERVERQVQPGNRLPMPHQEHWREERRSGGLRDGQTISARVARLDVCDGARGSPEDEVSGVARLAVDFNRSAHKTFERDPRVARQFGRGERKDEHAEALDTDPLTRRTDEALIVGSK